MSPYKNAIVAAALIVSIGLHWPILQSVAWLNMIVSYSQEDGIEQAVVKTFSGKHPCKICHVVAAGQKVERKDAKHISLKKPDLISETKTLDLLGPDILIPVSEFSATVPWVFYSPPTPPPNLV